MRASVIAVDVGKSRVDLRLLEEGEKGKEKGSGRKRKKGEEAIQVGKVVPAKIVKARPGFGFVLKLGLHSFGRVHICDIADAAVDAPLSLFKVGQLVRCCVLEAEEDGFALSLRPSRVSGKRRGEEEEAVREHGAFPEVSSVQELAVGQLLSGYVKSASSAGVFVQLGRQVTARVKISELSDG